LKKHREIQKSKLSDFKPLQPLESLHPTRKDNSNSKIGFLRPKKNRIQKVNPNKKIIAYSSESRLLQHSETFNRTENLKEKVTT